MSLAPLNCDWCGEPVEGTGPAEAGQLCAQFHPECLTRSIVGSVGHQLHRCSCYGGHFEDPRGMTKREAALAASNLNYLITILTT